MESSVRFEKPKSLSAINGIVRSNVKLFNKTIVITGANQGIGFETALDLAGRGARVVMACRNIEKAEEAAMKIKGIHKEADVAVRELDLSSLESVRHCAKVISEEEDRLDVLINNAGIMCCPKWCTKEGYEMQLGVNHIGHFLFTNLLLDLLKRSAPSRIIIVGSDGYKHGVMNWDDMMYDKSYKPFKVYFNSKLANVHHCLELSRRLQGTKVTCNCLHPGLVKTNLGQYMRGDHTPFLQRWLFRITWPLALLTFVTPKRGAQTSIYCAVAPELEGITGKYFSKCAEELLLPHALVEEDAGRLWKMSEEWVKNKNSSTMDQPREDVKDQKLASSSKDEDMNDKHPEEKITENKRKLSEVLDDNQPHDNDHHDNDHHDNQPLDNDHHDNQILDDDHHDNQPLDDVHHNNQAHDKDHHDNQPHDNEIRDNDQHDNQPNDNDHHDNERHNDEFSAEQQQLVADAGQTGNRIATEGLPENADADVGTS